MHFLIWETLSFNLMYVTACYPVGTTISKTSSLFFCFAAALIVSLPFCYYQFGFKCFKQPDEGLVSGC